MKYLAIIVLLLRPCVTSMDNRQPLGYIELAYDEVVEVKGTDLRITFNSVDEYRCPSDVRCVWAGAVNIQIVLEAAENRVIVPLTSSGHSSVHSSFDTLGYRFKLIAVAPYPARHDKPTSAADYVVTLNVSE